MMGIVGGGKVVDGHGREDRRRKGEVGGGEREAGGRGRAGASFERRGPRGRKKGDGTDKSNLKSGG